MEIELKCPGCPYGFAAGPASPSEDIRRRLTEEGPWLALGTGETFADMIASALLSRGHILCPECRRPLRVRDRRPEPAGLANLPV